MHFTISIRIQGKGKFTTSEVLDSQTSPYLKQLNQSKQFSVKKATSNIQNLTVRAIIYGISQMYQNSEAITRKWNFTYNIDMIIKELCEVYTKH